MLVGKGSDEKQRFLVGLNNNIIISGFSTLRCYVANNITESMEAHSFAFPVVYINSFKVHYLTIIEPQIYSINAIHVLG